ncbi:LytR/AlgR family response regulator transcription factor [Niabella aurantiaca]|uniref:LytR/AlgR family response regulator transcription factor n=1 Tax=Niabella aurantiaca TaxID=379900 RepID=UPI00035ED672|nr:LytTR family DNA-binding domain-containing protein [Niabella aurantiaca]
MQAVIVDDEPNNISNLHLMLSEHCPEIKIVASALNAAEGREAILLHRPALIFLDIQMPGQNGFDLLQSLPAQDFEVIFVTGFDKYGIQAIKFSAIDYLLKPIALADLMTAVARARRKIEEKKQNEQLKNLLLHLRQTDRQEHKIALPSAKEIRFIHPSDIIYCEAKNNYTLFYLQNDEKLTISRPLLEYDQLLEDYGFIRCHNSYLVNRHFIKSILKENGGSLLLENNVQLPVSRQKKEQIRQAMLKR